MARLRCLAPRIRLADYLFRGGIFLLHHEVAWVPRHDALDVGNSWPGATANLVALARTASYSSTVIAICFAQAPSPHSQLKLNVAAGVSPVRNCSATSATRSFTSRKRASLVPRRSSRAPTERLSAAASDVARFGVGDRGRGPRSNRHAFECRPGLGHRAYDPSRQADAARDRQARRRRRRPGARACGRGRAGLDGSTHLCRWESGSGRTLGVSVSCPDPGGSDMAYIAWPEVEADVIHVVSQRPCIEHGSARFARLDALPRLRSARGGRRHRQPLLPRRRPRCARRRARYRRCVSADPSSG